MDKTNWWERRWFLAFLVAASMVPLLWPETPPLVDVPGHMGRFRVQLDLANSPDLQRYFEFHWALVGNLGTDLLVQLLGPIMGLEPAVKLIVIAIPPLTVLGLIWVAKEIHGRVPPTLMFAIPFVYSFTFNFGFLNYSLTIACALLAFAFWLRLGALGRFRLRALLFVPISCALWVVHAFGWGILGLLAFSAELIRHHDREANWMKAGVRSALDVAPMGVPALVMLFGSGGGVVAGESGNFSVLAKFYAIVVMLRDRWLIWDSLAVGAALVLTGSAIFDRHLELSRKLVIPAAILSLAFIVMPGKILGLSFADVRLAPVIMILILLAIRLKNPDAARPLAWLGLAFLCLRLAGNTISFAIEDRQAKTLLTALDHIPQGAPVLFLTRQPCGERPDLPRLTHLGSMVIVRRNGFSNDQWQAAGAQLLRVRYPAAGFFQSDRSSVLYSHACLKKMEDKLGAMGGLIRYDRRTETALRTFPRAAFEYVWVIDPPDFEIEARPGLTPIWRKDRAVLYRIDRPQPEAIARP